MKGGRNDGPGGGGSGWLLLRGRRLGDKAPEVCNRQIAASSTSPFSLSPILPSLSVEMQIPVISAALAPELVLSPTPSRCMHFLKLKKPTRLRQMTKDQEGEWDGDDNDDNRL